MEYVRGYHTYGVVYAMCSFSGDYSFDKFFFVLFAFFQMARHVFQYDRMDPKLGLFLGDPSLVPPLPPLDEEQGAYERPIRADEAGLTWQRDERHPDGRDNRGIAHRQEDMLRQQRQDLLNPKSSAPPTPAVATASPSAPAYKPDGSPVR
jgi:hypothetical protein